ncbi:MAG TPA: T9SS type A sorting domain-containing protein, partial [Flavobacteriales bacterium]|nr:T9SS type A sorting domain-containing protein [Flavobacteriales bacterium]
IVEMQIEGLVTIANSLGQLIYTTNLVTGKNQLNIGNVARGTYTVRILNADGKTLIGTRRMVIMQ